MHIQERKFKVLSNFNHIYLTKPVYYIGVRICNDYFER